MSYSPRFRGKFTTAPTTSMQTVVINNTGITQTRATPVCINSSGELEKVSIIDENKALSIAGLLFEDVENGMGAEVINSGRMNNVDLPFAFGQPIYINHLGNLTNQKPSLENPNFVPGMFIVRVGVVAKNQLNPILKDLIININVIGQL